MCYIDGNGDAEGNYTVLARQDFTDASNNTGFAFLPVGHFEIIRHGQLPVRTYFFLHTPTHRHTTTTTTAAAALDLSPYLYAP